MFTWTPFPFIRIIIAFAAGILMAKWEILQSHQSHWIFLSACILLLAFFVLKLSGIRIRNFLSGNIALPAVALVAALRFFDYSVVNDQNHLLHDTKKIDGYLAQVNTTAVVKPKYFIYEVDLISVFRNDSSINKEAKVHLYVRKNLQDEPPLEYGDIISLAQQPFRLPPPKNPYEFNYMEYMAGRNIYFQQFVDITDLNILANKPNSEILALAYKLRKEFSEILSENINSREENAIAQALILGIRDGLDNDIKKSFSAAGAMHVLAVSGLHVGIIIGILGFLLRPIAKKKKGKYFATVISVTCLWLYAMIAGLSPSILRAATMFSIMIIGLAVNSRQSVYNSLAISAFILLFVNPNFLFSVGFQLSYIAVLGIVYIYPRIHRQFTFGNVVFEYMWSFTCLSIAAQLATFPLTLYYFHQFPVYFLISNLVVIPAAMLIMSFGIALLITGYTVVGQVLGFILKWLIFGLNAVVSFIEQLDFSLVDWLYLSSEQTILLYSMILTLLALLHYRKMKFVYLLGMQAMIISLLGATSLLKQSNEQKIVFYEIGGEAVFDTIDGLNAQLTSINDINNSELVMYQVGPNRLNSHLTQIDTDIQSLVSGGIDGLAYYQWKSLKFIFLTKPVYGFEFRKKLKADYVVVSNNSIRSAKFLKSNFDFKEVIIDSSNDYRTCKYYEKSNLKCRILRYEGALTIAL
ncbi:MAG: ComEC/Rec2 family competence protein [Cyclobacteriaceae bacterium]